MADTSKSTITLRTTNGDQTFTVVGTDEELTVRIAKDGHNRGVGKLDPSAEDALYEYLSARRAQRKKR